ncbi:hypothetical protein BGZ54_004559, partial [Gamsiella multidivaricata]
PATLTDIGWSVVSTAQIGAVYDISKFYSPTCYVDKNGVFTHIDVNIIKSPEAAPTLGGVQFSPSFSVNVNGTSTGLGGWKNIDMGIPYIWDKKSLVALLFTVKDSMGANVVIHLWVDYNTGNVFFGVLDNATMQLEAGPSWAFGYAQYYIRFADYYNGILMLLAVNSLPSKTISLITIPFNSTNIAPALPTNLTGYGPFNNTGLSPLLAGFFADNYYIVQRYDFEVDTTDSITIINVANITDAKFQPPVNMSTYINTFFDETRAYFWQPVGGLNGSPAFAYFERIDVKNNTLVSSVALNGPNVGQWMDVKYTINVTDTLGVNPNPSTPSPSSGNSTSFVPTDSSDSSDTPSKGLVIGCVVGGLAAIAAAVFVFMFFMRRLKKDTKYETVQTSGSGGGGGKTSFEEQSGYTEPQMQYQQQQVYTPYNAGLLAPASVIVGQEQQQQ